VGFVSKTKFSLKSKVRNVKIAEYDFASQSEMKKAMYSSWHFNCSKI
jgi:hypothetical protein